MSADTLRTCADRPPQGAVWHGCMGPLGTNSLLGRLIELIEAGKVTPVIDGTYPLSETATAIGRVGRGHASGTVVISMNGVQPI